MSTIPKELIEAVKKGECVLFVGAGVSKGAGLPLAGELAEELADEFLDGKHRDKPLAKVASFIEGRPRLGRLALIQHLEKRLQAARPARSHRLIPCFPWQAIYTTNYDQLIERGFPADRIAVILQSTEIDRSKEPRKVPLFKPHGCVSRARSEEVRLIITDNDYYETEANRKALYAVLKAHVYMATFLFVGYGLGDEDIGHIYHEVIRELGEFKRAHYAVMLQFSDDERRYWEQKGIILVSGKASDFFTELNYQINLADAVKLANCLIAREALHDRLYAWKALHDFLQDLQIEFDKRQWPKFKEFLSERLTSLAQEEIECLCITGAHDGGLAFSVERSLLGGIADSTARKHLEDCLDRVARCLDTLVRKQLAIDQALVRSQPVDYHISSLRGHVREHLDVSARALEEMKNGLRSSSEELWDNFKRIEDRFGDSDQVESFAKLKDLVEEMQRFIDNESRLVEWMDLHARFRKLELWLPSLKTAATQPQVANMGLFFAINEAWKCYKREAFHNIVQFKEIIEYINEAEGWITELQEKGEGIETKLEKINSTLRSIEAAPTEKLESQLRPSIKELQGLIQDFGKLVEEHFMSTDDKLKATAENLKKLFPVLQKSPLLKEQS